MMGGDTGSRQLVQTFTSAAHRLLFTTGENAGLRVMNMLKNSGSVADDLLHGNK